MLFGPQAQVFDAGGLIVVAGQAACGRRLQQRAVPHLLGVMGQRLVVGLAGQRAQRRRRHVDVHSQVRKRRRGGEVEGRVVHQVVGGSHVLAELLLQAEEAERRGGVRVALRERSAARQATAGGGGGGHRWRDQGRIWMEREESQVRDDADEDCDGRRGDESQISAARTWFRTQSFADWRNVLRSRCSFTLQLLCWAFTLLLPVRVVLRRRLAAGVFGRGDVQLHVQRNRADHGPLRLQGGGRG